MVLRVAAAGCAEEKVILDYQKIIGPAGVRHAGTIVKICQAGASQTRNDYDCACTMGKLFSGIWETAERTGWVRYTEEKEMAAKRNV